MNMKKIVAGVIACCVAGGTLPLLSTFNIANNVVAVEMDQVDPSLTYQTNSSGYISITGFDNSVASVEIPAEIDSIPVKTISNEAFKNGTKLETIVIPEGVTVINNYAFSGCTSLKEIHLPSTLIYIGDYAFEKCISLEDINIPDGVKTIGNCAFYNCVNLLTLEFPSCVSEISESVAEECRNLQNVVINNGPIGIRHNSFKNCTKLKTVSLPISIVYMNGSSSVSTYDYSFQNCSAIEDVYYAGNAEQWAIISNTSNNVPNNAVHYGEKSPTLYELAGRKLGDMNGDGFIDASDASEILAYYAYLSTGGTLDYNEYREMN